MNKKVQSNSKKPSGFLKTRCANLEQQPRFIRAGFFNANRYKTVRSQGFFQRYLLAMILKERGNRLFKLGLHCVAINEYEQSFSVFTFFEKVHYANAVEDDLYQVQYVGVSEKEINLLKDLRLKLYMNLAACYLKQNYNEDVERSCDFAIEIDPTQVKAYYRRARARKPCDIRFAIEDLQIAASLVPNDLDIRKELQRLLSTGRTQNKLDMVEKIPIQLEEKTLIKVPPPSRNSSPTSSSSSSTEFESTQMTNEEATQFWQQFNINKDYENFNYELSYEEDPEKPIPDEVYELGHFIEFRGVQMLKVFESQGRLKEAEQLQEKLKKALAAKQQLEKISRLDFSRPKPHLQEIALRFGIDLLENQVQNEFKRIQYQNILDIKNWLQQNQWKSVQATPSQKKITTTQKSHMPKIQKTTSHRHENPRNKQIIQTRQQIICSPPQQKPQEYVQEHQLQGQGGQVQTCDDSFITQRVQQDEVVTEPITPIIDEPIVIIKENLTSYWSPFLYRAIFLNTLAIFGVMFYKLIIQ